MHRLISVAARHGIRNYITSSSFSQRRAAPNSLQLLLLLRHSSSSSASSNCCSYFQNLMTLVTETSRRHSDDDLHQQCLLRVLEASRELKLVETLKVPPRKLILFIGFLWNNNHKDLITAPVIESLVSSLCSLVTNDSYSKLDKNKDIRFMWKLVKRIAHYHSACGGGVLNAHILNQFLQSFQEENTLAREVFLAFHLFQCLPNRDTLQSLYNTTNCDPLIIHQCQNSLLLFPHHDDSSQDYYHLPPTSCHDVTASIDFFHFEHSLNSIDFATPRHHQQHFLLNVIENSCQTQLVETQSVPPRNLILFVKLVWKKNKNLITTPVLESLVSATLGTTLATCTCTPLYFIQQYVEQRKNDVLFLWGFLKHIGHYHPALLNTWILNQLIGFFRYMDDQGEDALQVFRKFEVFQCEPDQDTYTNTMLTLVDMNPSAHVHQLASSICQKMVLHPQTLLPDDGFVVGEMLTWFSQQNMIEETHALYLAAKEKRKTDPNWPLHIHIDMLLPYEMIKNLCSKKETVHLALEMLNGIDTPEEVEDWENGADMALLRIVNALCFFKDFDAAKHLIFKMSADGPLPRPSQLHICTFIRASVRAGEIGQALEMVVLLESIGLNTCDVFKEVGLSNLRGVKVAEKILEEAKKKDVKSIIALLYHTLIDGYCCARKFDKAQNLLTQMKDFGFSHRNLDEYHRLIHSFCLKNMHRKMAEEQLDEMEPMDRKMAQRQLDEIGNMDWNMYGKQIEEMDLKIRVSFCRSQGEFFNIILLYSTRSKFPYCR